MSQFVIGKMYKVPCIHVEPRYIGLNEVPVLGKKHTDPILDFPQEHYHIDWRFVPDAAYDLATLNRSRTPLSRVVCNTHRFEHGLLNDPAPRWRKCRRQMPDFPSLVTYKTVREYPKTARLWEALEADQRNRCNRLIDGHICPHRGIDLRPFAKDDGTVICPGHGLRWNLTTGEMLPHHSVTP